MTLDMRVIARVRTDLPDKFALPRQSGRAEDLTGRIVFEEAYRDRNALRGIEEYSDIWIIWVFDKNESGKWSPTVRPPRLGGNERRGVFATRSPFRPNPIGLSRVRLLGTEETRDGVCLLVSGVDMADGTAVLDIKPYIAYCDSRPDARGSFAEREKAHALEVDASDPRLACLPEDKRKALMEVLRDDPRPAYIDDPRRVFGFRFAGREVRFRVEDGRVYIEEITCVKEEAE